MKTYKVILKESEDKFCIHTITDCKDLDDCIEFVKNEFPNMTIQHTITEDGEMSKYTY